MAEIFNLSRSQSKSALKYWKIIAIKTFNDKKKMHMLIKETSDYKIKQPPNKPHTTEYQQDLS